MDPGTGSAKLATENSDTAALNGVAKRVISARDMVEWLWLDGFYHGFVGWTTECASERYSGTPPARPYVFGDTDVSHGSTRPLQRDFDMNAALKEISREVALEAYVGKMLREHKKLIPDAIREIDLQLLKAGVSPEAIKAMTTGTETGVYAKLARLDEALKPHPPRKRIQFRVMCDIRDIGWTGVNIYLPRNCLLVDFEDSLLSHGLTPHIRQPADIQCFATRPNGQKNLDRGTEGTLRLLKKPGVDRKVWTYKLAAKGDRDDALKPDGCWKALCDQGDFTEMMVVLVREECKMAVVCHETTLGAPMRKERTGAEMPQMAEAPAVNWDGGVEEPIDWGTDNWEIDDCRLIPDDFDWSRVRKGRIIDWKESPKLGDSSAAGGNP